MADVVTTPRRYFIAGGRSSFARFVLWLTVLMYSVAAPASGDYDRDQALRISQAALGKTLGGYSFIDSDGQVFRLDQMQGKPFLISMIFTSCHHICPTATRHLAGASRSALDVLGDDAFDIVTIGFDTSNDTPAAMQGFARQQGVDRPGWRFLSADRETIEALSADLGFQFFPSARGFDHLNQLSVIDRDGRVYSQVYGVSFSLPALVEPLKQLVFNRPQSAGHPVATLVDKVRLFCTVYNPATGRYEIDNSLFIQTAIGLLIVLSVAVYLFREARRARRS